MSNNSDVRAKEAFINHLLSSGYDSAKVIKSPSDIVATKTGEEFYFEIKYTRKEKKYFGAATLTEWEFAINNQKNYRFVIAFERNGNWVFHEYTPTEFMAFSTIPPFKVFFHVNINEGKISNPPSKKTKSVPLNTNTLQKMIDLFKLLKS
jgi:hypothetical protein